MPKLDKRITDSLVKALRGPETPEEITATFVVHWCKDTQGFGLRVSTAGQRAYVFQRRVDGKTIRRTLGKAVGAGAISADAARKQMNIVSGELEVGMDRLEVKREAAKVEKEEGITLAMALAEYVKDKRIGETLPLKDRTKADYMAMVGQGGTAKDGKPFHDGPLYPLADTPLTKITAEAIRKEYDVTLVRSKRRAVYAMQVLRAVLNWHGVEIPDSPFKKSTAGKVRIKIAPTKGNPTAIPKDKLGAWWRAATARAGNAGADGCRMILLTGCRPGEIFGNMSYVGDKRVMLSPGLLVQDVDLIGGRMVLLNTKNRKDHTVMLSTQALAVLEPHCKGKKPDAKVFDVLDPGKTLDAINETAGVVGITPHKLRHTFASVAAKKCSVYELKAMLNHSSGGDVTAEHYVDVDDTDLADAWQRVADFIVNA
jgi:integrase